jgi:EmrB/QacA subfamily drug resistance transporter
MRRAARYGEPVAPTATGETASRRRTLIACILGSAIVFLDGTVVNVALPAIGDDLGTTLAGQQWVVEAYLLALGSLILVGGSLGDLLGRRRVFAAGVAGFGVCSLLCALAPSTATLILARGAQGVAGALLVPSTLALIVDTFSARERGAAIGTWTAWTGVATVVGPVGGGALLAVASWRWIFAINVVPVLATLWLLRSAPAGQRRRETPIDWTGALLCALGLGGPVLALTEQQRRGWEDPLVLGPLLGGVALLVAFVLWERRARDPMLPLSLFRERNFSVTNLATFAVYGGLSVATLFLVVFLQQVAGYSALGAGLALMPITLLLFALSRRFGALADRFGPRRFMGAGPLLGGAGLLLLLLIDDASPSYLTEVLPGVTLFGVGLAMTVAPLTTTVLASAGGEHAGVASGVNNAIARVAGMLAIAAVGAVIAAHAAARLEARLPPASLSPAGRAAVQRAQERVLVDTAPGVPASERPRAQAALADASVAGLRLGMGIAGALVLAGGVISLVGVRDLPASSGGQRARRSAASRVS